MIVSYDTEAGATYVSLADVPVHRTESVSDLVMVDVDEHDEPIGVDFAIPPSYITADMLSALAERWPALKSLQDVGRWLPVSAGV